MKIDKYDLYARKIPVILTSIPIFTIYYYVLNPQIGDFLDQIFKFKIASDITFITALIYFQSQINRILSKDLVENIIFENKFKLPTTEIILYEDDFLSDQLKNSFSDKIEEDFGIKIPSKSKQLKNQSEAKRVISEAISRVRTKHRSINLVEQHNIEYGFQRNLLGGSIFATFLSIFNFMAIYIWFQNNMALSISLVCSIIYLVISLVLYKGVKIVGKSYAETLINEYMSS